MDQTKFGAGEFCKVTGISAETLRHYADCGIIDSIETDTNNYKKYSARNAMDVLHARMCRGLELPIPKIIHKAEIALLEQEALLIRHEAILEAEAAQMSLKLERMKQQVELMAFARSQLNQVKVREAAEVPNLYRLFFIGDNLRRDSETERVTNQWMEYPQYTHVAIRAPLSSLLDTAVDELPMSLGIGVREEYVKKLNLDTRPPVSFFPQARNIGTVIATFDPLRLRKSDLRNIFDRVAELRFQITSDLVGRLCTFVETDKGRLYYFTASVCIK